MKNKKIILSIILLMLVLCIPTYAAEAENVNTGNADEHVFTKEELAGITNENSPVTVDGESIPINLIEGETARSASSTTTTYYIIAQNDGDLLTCPSSGAFSRTRYSEGNSNSHVLQKWVFEETEDGYYVIYPYNDTSKCLTVSPNGGAVYYMAYGGMSRQKWEKRYSSDGNYLQTMATQDTISGCSLKINEYSCSVVETGFSRVGFFDVTWYVPCTSMSFPVTSLNVGESKYIYPTYLPSNATGYGDRWSNYKSASTTVFTVSNKGQVTAIGAGSKKLTITDRITDVTYSANVNVTRLPNANAQNKTMWCWAAASKKVGTHNGGGSMLPTGAVVTSSESGLHGYGDKLFYGQTYSGTKTVDAGQRKIVVEIHGSDVNQGGDEYDATEAIQEVAVCSVAVETYYASNATTDALYATYVSRIIEDLQDGLWVYGRLKNDSGVYHAIVITGYSQNVFTFWDPWIDDVDTFLYLELIAQSISLESGATGCELYSYIRCYQTQ